eukprot:1814993-Amphidinium_carterae.1
MSSSASHDMKAEKAEDVQNHSLLIIADKKDIEGASSAFILRELLIPIIAPLHEVTAHVFTHGGKLPVETITKVALVCTSGLFEDPIITTLLQLRITSLVTMPLICSSSFVFPTPQVLKGSEAIKGLQAEEQAKLISMIQVCENSLLGQPPNPQKIEMR